MSISDVFGPIGVMAAIAWVIFVTVSCCTLWSDYYTKNETDSTFRRKGEE